MAKDAHSCLGCGRLTTIECQICYKCTRGRGSYKDTRGAASSCGPLTELASECQHNYSEDALGPHTSDERWDWEYLDDVETEQ